MVQGVVAAMYCLCDGASPFPPLPPEPPLPPPSVPPARRRRRRAAAAALPLNGFLCGGRDTAVRGGNLQPGYFYLGAPNTVSIEFCFEMARLFDAEDGGGTSIFGVGNTHHMGFEDNAYTRPLGSTDPIEYICGGATESTDPNDCAAGTTGICTVVVDFQTYGPVVKFTVYSDTVASATEAARRTKSVERCITGTTSPQDNTYCLCDVQTTPPFPPAPPAPPSPPPAAPPPLSPHLDFFYSDWEDNLTFEYVDDAMRYCAQSTPARSSQRSTARSSGRASERSEATRARTGSAGGTIQPTTDGRTGWRSTTPLRRATRTTTASNPSTAQRRRVRLHQRLLPAAQRVHFVGQPERLRRNLPDHRLLPRRVRRAVHSVAPRTDARQLWHVPHEHRRGRHATPRTAVPGQDADGCHYGKNTGIAEPKMDTYYCVYGQANNWWRVTANCRRGNESRQSATASAVRRRRRQARRRRRRPRRRRHRRRFRRRSASSSHSATTLRVRRHRRRARSAPSWASGSSSSRGWIAQCYRQEHGGTLAVLRNAADQAAAVSAISAGFRARAAPSS